MTEMADRTATTRPGYPLSSPQELWYSGDKGDQAGFFGSGFILASALRITGRVDVPALQAALDDLVVRHEILRTTVVREVEPPYQRVDAAAPVPLEVRDLPVPAGRRRDLRAEELLAEAEQRAVHPREMPVVRAILARFDETDSVLALTVHHTAVDEWSMQVIIRDLSVCYAARKEGREPVLPEARQYREFSAWQQAAANSAAGDTARGYWRQKMHGAQIFAVPADYPVPDTHDTPCTTHNFTVDAGVMAGVAEIAEAAGATAPVVLLAAFNVLAHEIAGTTDQAIDTLTTGRTDSRFDDTVGPVMNFLVFRTDIGPAGSFLDVVKRTQDSWAEAYAHEIPIQHIEWEAPHVMEPNDENLKTNCIIGFFELPFDEADLQIGEGSTEIRKRTAPTPVGPWIPHGVAWALHLLRTGELTGSIQYNLEDVGESTVAGWAASYRRILANAAENPYRQWKML
ncbi:condensation domain-containing protein [Amycolatopsis sp. NPDC005003]